MDSEQYMPHAYTFNTPGFFGKHEWNVSENTDQRKVGIILP